MSEVDLEELRARGGKPAKAMIKATKRGKKLKGDPSQIVWKVTLRVTPDDAQPFDAVIQAPFPEAEGGPSMGRLIGVVYDPHNHQNLAIDPTAPVASFGQLQAGMQQHIVEEAMRSPGASIFMGGRWINGPGTVPASAPAPAARHRASPASWSGWPASGTKARSPRPSSRPRRRSSSARRPPRVTTATAPNR